MATATLTVRQLAARKAVETRRARVAATIDTMTPGPVLSREERTGRAWQAFNYLKQKQAARRQEAIEREARHAAAREIVTTGKCPDCGLPLFRNNSLAGWFQCAAYPCESFRKPEFKNAPKCEFQIFTE